QGGGATTLRSTVPMRDRIWHRLFKRGGEYFMSLRYASSPRPLLLVVDSAFDAQVLRPLFLELQASYPPTNGGAAANPGQDLESLSSSRSSLGKGAPQERPPRVVLTGRGGTAVTCPLAAKELGNTEEGRGRGATLCNPDTFASAWNLAAGRHFPRHGAGRAGGSGGRDHVLMADLAAGLAGAVKTLKPLAIVSVVGTGPAWAGDAGAAAGGGRGGGGAAIDEALAVVAGQAEMPVIRLPRRSDASAAALWLTRLTPKAFRAWHKPQVDLIVVYEPRRAGGSGGGHTEAQLEVLMKSLSKAHYLGDHVGLTVAVGSGPVPESVSGESFSWPRGRKVVRGGSLLPSLFPGNFGSGADASPPSLTTLALRSWTPREEESFVVVLEADRVVSPLFYSWLKVAMLETYYGGAAPKPSSSAARSARTALRGSICIPSAGGGGGGGRGSTWLLPAGYWQAAQAQCLGKTAALANVAGGRGIVCEGPGFPEPPEPALCPTLQKPAEALVGQTDADGILIDAAGNGLMIDGTALAKFVGRALFS
ncbi:unnamed protein product, partial [Hapterophycus canaliculatus]